MVSFDSRLDQAEERINELADSNWNYPEDKKRMKKNEEILWDLKTPLKETSVHIIGIPEREKWEKCRKVI